MHGPINVKNGLISTEKKKAHPTWR